MLTILSANLDESVKFLKQSFDDRLIKNTLIITNPTDLTNQIATAVKTSRIVVVCGQNQIKVATANAFNLAMGYDKFAETNVKKLCALTKQPLPAQYLLDSYCSLPETFIHYVCNFTFQSPCFGEINKVGIYLLPNNIHEVRTCFENYLLPYVSKVYPQGTTKVYKIFGLQNKDVYVACSNLCNVKNVTFRCVTENLDTKLTVQFQNGVNKPLIDTVNNQIIAHFGDYLYAKEDVSLQQAVVDHLHLIHKRVAVAESLTGGLIASKIVEVPGASSVFFEGLVTYSVSSKCERLGVNPHLVDQCGVVSREVAESMAKNLLSRNIEFSLSTTGFAGPKSDDGMPVGLCYIGVGTPKGVYVYKNIFSGDRQQIRQQASNSALYFLWKALNTK